MHRVAPYRQRGAAPGLGLGLGVALSLGLGLELALTLWLGLGLGVGLPEGEAVPDGLPISGVRAKASGGMHCLTSFQQCSAGRQGGWVIARHSLLPIWQPWESRASPIPKPTATRPPSFRPLPAMPPVPR